MLERHAAAVATLRGVERVLLSDQVAALEGALEPGLARLCWTSLTIPDFEAAVSRVRGVAAWRQRCGCCAGQGAAADLPSWRLQLAPAPPAPLRLPAQALDQFSALVAQVQTGAAQMERVVQHIARARLVPPAAPHGDGTGTGEGEAAVPDLHAFFEGFEQHHLQVRGGGGGGGGGAGGGPCCAPPPTLPTASVWPAALPMRCLTLPRCRWSRTWWHATAPCRRCWSRWKSWWWGLPRAKRRAWRGEPGWMPCGGGGAGTCLLEAGDARTPCLKLRCCIPTRDPSSSALQLHCLLGTPPVWRRLHLHRVWPAGLPRPHGRVPRRRR